MALYLFMDGIDDFLRSPSVTWTEVIIDMSVDHKTSTAQVYIDGRPGVGFTYVLRNTSNNDEHSGFANGVFIDGVSKSSGTPYVPTNQRVTMRAVRNATGTGAITFFAHNNGGQQFVKGNIYNIKIYNGTTLLAHYDMTTGTVQDQSGNGRHATLTGGTWLDDGTGGGSTGTDGSIDYAMRQRVYSDTFANASMRQAVYADNSLDAPMRSVIYRDGAEDQPLRQRIYSDSASDIATRQRIYSDAQMDVAMRQRVYADGFTDAGMLIAVLDLDYTDGYADYGLRQTVYRDGVEDGRIRIAVYADGLADVRLRQAIYTNGTLDAATRQRIYSQGLTDARMRQVVYADTFGEHRLRIRVYGDGYADYGLRQTIFDPDRTIIERVQWSASRELRVQFSASRELRVKWEGGLPMKIMPPYTMKAGDSRFFDTEIDFDLTGAVALVWLVHYHGTPAIVKDLSSGLRIVSSGEINVVEITLVPDDTDLIKPNAYEHVMKVKDAQGYESTIMGGKITFETNRTKDYI